MTAHEEPAGVRMMTEGIEQNEAEAHTTAIGCANWYCRNTSVQGRFRLVRFDKGTHLVALPLCFPCADAVEHRIGYFSDHRRGCRAVCYCGWSGPWRDEADPLLERDGSEHIAEALP